MLGARGVEVKEGFRMEDRRCRRGVPEILDLASCILHPASRVPRPVSKGIYSRPPTPGEPSTPVEIFVEIGKGRDD